MIIYKCVTNLSEAEGLVLICVFKVITIACEGEKNLVIEVAEGVVDWF